MMATWSGAAQKFHFIVQKNWFFFNNKHFRQNIMTSYYFCFGPSNYMEIKN